MIFIQEPLRYINISDQGDRSLKRDDHWGVPLYLKTRVEGWPEGYLYQFFSNYNIGIIAVLMGVAQQERTKQLVRWASPTIRWWRLQLVQTQSPRNVWQSLELQKAVLSALNCSRKILKLQQQPRKLIGNYGRPIYTAFLASKEDERGMWVYQKMWIWQYYDCKSLFVANKCIDIEWEQKRDHAHCPIASQKSFM